jgi:hypothetical protein
VRFLNIQTNTIIKTRKERFLGNEKKDPWEKEPEIILIK